MDTAFAGGEQDPVSIPPLGPIICACGGVQLLGGVGTDGPTAEKGCHPPILYSTGIDAFEKQMFAVRRPDRITGVRNSRRMRRGTPPCGGIMYMPPARAPVSSFVAPTV